MSRRLTTESLILEPMDERHFIPLAKLRADPEVMKFRYGGAESEEQTRKELQSYIRCWRDNGFGIWALLDKSANSFLGEGGLFNRGDGRGVALRFAFVKSAWGRGLAGELTAAALEFGFSNCELSRIVGVAQADNIASRRVMERAGMVRQNNFENNGVRLVLYAMERPR